MYSFQGLESDSEEVSLVKSTKNELLQIEKTVTACFGKDSFTTFSVELVQVPFPKTSDCIDIVSYDVGTKNLGCSRIRYCSLTKQCCIVHAALLDIYNPFLAIQMENDIVTTKEHVGEKRSLEKKKRKSHKPDHVQPFHGSFWPLDCEYQNSKKCLQTFHKSLLETHSSSHKDSEKDKWTKDVLRLSLAIRQLEWTIDEDIDHVLVEHQHNDNIHMRVLGYCIVDMYQSIRMCFLQQMSHSACNFASISTKTQLHLFSSILKLSEGVINTLMQTWFVAYQNWNNDLQFAVVEGSSLIENEDENSEKSEEKVQVLSLEQFEQGNKKQKIQAKNSFLHDEMVNRSNHGQRKQSSVRVLEHLFAPSNDKNQKVHPFRDWLRVQRAEKHNTCDSILQAFAWIVKNEQEPSMVKIRNPASKKKPVKKN